MSQTTRTATALLALLATITNSACGSATRPGRPGTPSRPTPRHTAGPEETAAARNAALAAYAGYLNAAKEASRIGDPMAPELSKYLADPLLTRVRLAIRTTKEHGAMRTGTLRSDPVVTAVSLDSVPATVEIQDCLDATDYRLVYIRTKTVVPGTAGRRHLATATATRYAGRWLISAGAGYEDQPC